MMRSGIAVAVCLALAACGGSEMGPCTVTATAEGATITCPDGTTATVSDGSDGTAGAQGQQGTAGTNGVNGTNGAPGADGSDGTDGVDGADGTDGQDGADGQDGTDGINNHIVATHFCTALLEATVLHFNYSVAVTSAGDVFATGAIEDPLLEVRGTSYYAAAQNGAATARVILTLDEAPPANGGWWTIDLDRGTLVTAIVYHDADVSTGQAAWLLTPDVCITNVFP